MTHKHRRTTTCGHSKKRMAICKPRRDTSLKTNPDGPLTLDFQIPELQENTFLLFHSPILSYTNYFQINGTTFSKL